MTKQTKYNYICPPNLPKGVDKIENHKVLNGVITTNVHPVIAQANLSVLKNKDLQIIQVRWINEDGSYCAL